jgi:putative urate catabolism protein
MNRIPASGDLTVYPRNMIGYADRPPTPTWPNGARLAIQFVVNYEEGGENCLLHGDAKSESYLTELVGTQPLQGARSLTIESLYEYGSRVGFWRLLNLFNKRKLTFTCFAVSMALQRNPRVAQALVEGDHEIACHGWRWIDYDGVDEATEREHMAMAIETIQRLTGTRPVGWYLGRVSMNTRRLVAEEGGFLYDADSYADDVPYWEQAGSKHQLIVPYTLDVNDMKFGSAQGFNSGDQFFTYLKDSFDCLYEEGATQARMMSVGLHCRIAGKPGRIRALKRFLDYIQGFDDVWVCRRMDIARHWHQNHPKA